MEAVAEAGGAVVVVVAAAAVAVRTARAPGNSRAATTKAVVEDVAVGDGESVPGQPYAREWAR